MGALIGHSCAPGVWTMENLERELNKPESAINSMQCSPEQIEYGKKLLQGLVMGWYPALRRLSKRALCSCVDPMYSLEELEQFLKDTTEASEWVI
jgi:hypothetical protein